MLAALAHLALNFDGNGPLIGASGAVAGVMGAYIVLYPHARVFVLFRIVDPDPAADPGAVDAGGVDRDAGVLRRSSARKSPVAWWAHLGGVVAGALLAVPLKRKEVALFGGR